MKKTKTILGTILITTVLLTSCGHSDCDCAKALNFANETGAIVINPNMTAAEVGDCTRKYNTTDTLGRTSALRSALKNAQRKCNN